MDNQKSKLDKFFSNPAAAVAMAILCNILWGSALPFIKMGYRMFAIDSSDTATIPYPMDSLFCRRPLHDGRGAGLAGRAGA